mmetsp:Transcript_64298/g.153337  ORF Transcript_64298/g.153337 Transcript_64298/m.153337 type:complete len:393 (-) Transcript_64298:82-1260(-)
MRNWLRQARRLSTIKDADEVDNVNTLHSVVSALMVATIFTLQYSMSPDEMYVADFRSLVCRSPVFRQYVHQVLQLKDVGTYKREIFNFTQLVGLDTYMDVEDELLHRIGERHGTNDDFFDHLTCIYDYKVLTVVSLITEYFPMEHLSSFILNLEDVEGKRVWRWSQMTEFHGGLACAFVLVGLFWSILFNLSLALAPAREDETGGALKHWLWIVGPLMILNYLFLIIGLVFFCLAHTRYLVGRSPYAMATMWNVGDVPMLCMILPLSSFGAIMSVAGVLWSTTKWRRKRVASPTSRGSRTKGGKRALGGKSTRPKRKRSSPYMNFTSENLRQTNAESNSTPVGSQSFSYGVVMSYTSPCPESIGKGHDRESTNHLLVTFPGQQQHDEELLAG